MQPSRSIRLRDDDSLQRLPFCCAGPVERFRGNLARVQHGLDLAAGEGPLVDLVDQEMDAGRCRRRLLTCGQGCFTCWGMMGLRGGIQRRPPVLEPRPAAPGRRSSVANPTGS
jgi:hypothetical protein